MKSKTQIRTKGPRKIQAALVALLAVTALVLLNGCASVPVQGNSDPLQYNAETGLSGSRWRLALGFSLMSPSLKRGELR